MVMFNCNRCSTGLKKKDVGTHSFKCGGKSNISLTCVDCLKDFSGDTYDGHTSCVSEEVRYGGKGAVSKPTGVKQNKWLGIVRQVLSQKGSLDNDVEKFLESIQHFENIPRNKKKFQNWAFSAKHVKDTNFLDRVFDALQKEFIKNSAPVDKGSDKTNGQKNGLSKDDDKKRKTDIRVEQSDEEGETESSKVGTNGHATIDSEDSAQVSDKLVSAEELPETNTESLSKKQKKLLKKKRKFETELKEVNEYQKEEIVEGDAGEQKLSKSKKRKLQNEPVNENTNCETSGTKKKKAAVNENEDSQKMETADLNNEQDEIESPTAKASKKKKFQWQITMLDVLTKSKKDKISIKRLAKKVVNEYVSIYGDKMGHDKLNATFNRKFKKLKGVKVLNDKVSLAKEEENGEDDLGMVEN